jgi:hypothetical protein
MTSKIVFARPRLNLNPYLDCWQLIRLSGFPLIYIDQIPEPGVRDTTFIYTPILGDWDIRPPETDGRVIGWDLEYRRGPYPDHLRNLEIWHMDAAQARMLGVKYVPVGSHPDFAASQRTNLIYAEKVDVCYLGYMGPHRRQNIAYQLDQRGITRTPEHAYGDERDVLLRASRVYLHVHQHDDIAAVPGLRMAVAAAYGLPVISETCTDPGIFAGRMLTSDYAHLTDFTALWLRDRDNQRMVDIGRSLHSLLCVENTFRSLIERAL